MSWLSTLLALAVLAAVVRSLMTVVASLRFDAREIRQARDRKRQPNARRYRARPPIGVIILFDGNVDLLTNSLTALSQSRYPNLQVIVSDQSAAGKANQAALKNIAVFRSKLNIRYQYSRRPQTLASALQKASKSLRTASLLLPIENGVVVAPAALREAAIASELDSKWQILEPELRWQNQESVAKLMHIYDGLMHRRVQKARVAVELSAQSIGLQIIYRRDYFKQVIGSDSKLRLTRRFAPQVGLGGVRAPSLADVLTRPVQRMRADVAMNTTRIRRPNNLRERCQAVFIVLACAGHLVIITLGFATLYLALRLNQPALAIVISASYAVLLLLAISDGPLHWPEKARLTLLFPPFLLLLLLSQAWLIVTLVLHILQIAFTLIKPQRPALSAPPLALTN